MRITLRQAVGFHDLVFFSGRPFYGFPDGADIQVTDRRFSMAAVADRAGRIDVGKPLAAIVQPGIDLWVALLQCIRHPVQDEFNSLSFGQELHGNSCHTEQGRLFLETDLGFGLVHTLDSGVGAEVVESGEWGLDEMDFALMPAHFGYVLSPAAAQRTR